jgi:hypothetical protein
MVRGKRNRRSYFVSVGTVVTDANGYYECTELPTGILPPTPRRWKDDWKLQHARGGVGRRMVAVSSLSWLHRRRVGGGRRVPEPLGTWEEQLRSAPRTIRHRSSDPCA